MSTHGLKTLPAYVTGLILSLLLTLAAFGLIAAHLYKPEYIQNMSVAAIYITIAVLALIQLIVQVACFLRLNASAEGKWELMPFIFTLLIVAILVSGSLWIMYNLNYNMMH
ncbi:MAG: cytochrome o ubiquinol oxidase subunit IV [Gammaproteobacteria bacterium]|nr:cytochrome o ubiquinol oxidase subunit IV [Gammaproteobacteria bacterium]